MKRFKMIASSYLILVEDGKVLLSRRFQTGYMDGHYSLPAGHVDKGETIEDCLVREVFEEIGIEIKRKDVKLVHIMHRKENDIRLDFFYTIKSYDGTVKNMEPSKCDDLKWFKLDQLPSNVLPYIKQGIENSLKKVLYSDIGF
ncbi:MAG: NUDIX domain-containing protein [Candidatus Beckwithbacteria bacterium]